MNINPKKSWHVHSEENVKKVLADEEKHREEEAMKEKKRLLAEQEHRLDSMRAALQRKKADLGLTDAPDRASDAIIVSEKPKHINFFEEEEKLRDSLHANPEYEAEKKAEEAKLDAKFTSYLGQGSAETMSEKPFYLHSQSTLFQEDVEVDKDGHVLVTKYDEMRALRDKRQHQHTRHDPLRKIYLALGRSEDVIENPTTRQAIEFHSTHPALPPTSGTHDQDERTDKSSHRKSRKERKREEKEERRRNKKRKHSGDHGSSSERIQKLRQERIERENLESARARAIFSGELVKSAPAFQNTLSRRR